MKRLIILIMALCVMSVSYAQEKKCGMLDGEPVWSCYYLLSDGCFYYKCYLNGTIDIDGKTYHRLYMEVVKEGAGGLIWGAGSDDGYLLGIREENGRILANEKEFGSPSDFHYSGYYTYESTDEGEVVLYDFNVTEGRTYDMIDMREHKVAYQRKVVDVDSVRLYNGEMRKIFTIEEKYNEKYHIVENVGAIDWRWGVPFWHVCYSDVGTMNDIGHCLNVFMQNGEVVYKAPDYEGDPSKESLSWTTYRADPFLGDLSTGIKDVNADKAAERDNSIYDLTGRKLSAKPEKGIYIQGGKKYVVR